VRSLIKKTIGHEFIRFLFTGAINTLFGYLVYVIFYWTFKDKTIALIFDYAISIIFNFKSYSILVFNSSNNWRIVRFIIVYIFAFVLNYYSLVLFCDIFKFHAYIGQIFALIYVPLVLYFLLKYYVFNDKQTKNRNEEQDDSI